MLKNSDKAEGYRTDRFRCVDAGCGRRSRLAMIHLDFVFASFISLAFVHGSAIVLAVATELPFLQLSSARTNPGYVDVDVKGKKWWSQVGSRIYHAPEKNSRLSPNIEDYYYAMGSSVALTDELRAHRVGGEGRVHIFHLPKGHAMLQIAQRDRRSSLSGLRRLTHGAIVPTELPEYIGDAKYKNPLSFFGQQVEKQAVAALTEESLMGYLRQITSLQTRSSDSAAGSTEAVFLLKSELESLGLTVCPLGTVVTNVIAHVPGTSSGTIVVGAHYDSRPFQGAAPGAEDNGSGIAALLAMAKALTVAKVKPRKSIYFVAFGGEELGLVGSHEFVDDLAAEGESIPERCKQGHAINANSTIAIIMDEIGWKSPRMSPTVNLEAFDWTSDVMDHLAHSSRDHNGDKLKITHNNQPFGSDHVSFLNMSIPAVLTINGDDEAYPNYHSSRDTIDNVDPQYATSIARMNMGALLRLAGLREAPSKAGSKAANWHQRARPHGRSSLRASPW